MQNLTAHYNILYNAKELINLSEKNIQLNYADNYDRVISVYKEPNESLSQSELKNLDDAILKANTIANEKSLSKYVDDAYFLIAKANHLKSNFFNAVEFFNYVYINYPLEKEIRQAALAWKARSLIASDRMEEAESTLDTAISNILSEKRSVADIYATRAHLYIYAKQDQEAINLLERALKTVKNKQKKIRWTYLTAQLYEITGQAQNALSNYTKVIKSNAPFDMAFNANLSRINLKTELSGDTSGRTREIMALLKDDKNRELLDQVYFQIANSYAQANNFEKAIENYNLAVSKSTKNLNLKGLAYLELAEIYFNKSDFLMSKAYYDSTLISLPKNYPDYLLIKKKADNLEVLANSLSIIAQQDTLQMLAQLPDAERKERIGKMMLEQTEKAQSGSGIPVGGNAFNPTTLISSNSRDTRFYFNNSAALSQGLADFKKRWGPRKLEDNWRRSQRTVSEMPSAILPDPGSAANPFPMQEIKTEPDMDARIMEYILSVPVSPEQKAESNQKIASALYDIANYYRDISADTAEAVKTYEQLLNRFPENQNKLAVYYNLYRLYSTANKKRSDEYKNILLTKFPESPFAKIIIDPDFSQKQDEQEAAFNRLYNDIYDLYVKKNYTEMLNSIEKYRQVSGVQKVPAQLAYLNSLAIGHTQKLPGLENAFKEIISNFPDEKLIVPLIKQHLAFIDSNRIAMAERIVALSDMDFNNRFFQEAEMEQPAILVAEPDDNKPIADNKEKPQTVKLETTSETGLFRNDDSAQHYFVVNISDPSVNLSSSRFGIGQFNRANLPGSAIKHQLKSVANQNQLIFVGPFTGKEAVTTYFTNISPLMRAIMKIPVGKYNTFIINSQNLEKIIDKETLDLYVEYYKRNY
ncbi:tetratricopeptide repeat protein [Daejeonella sp.]|uniref:type IX secretion system periplasmic lipoprotein PorW/SprE n=1 Tax=Daejeonella sp. TaxID=2805397 RepID=UPI0026D360CC|nr:tetratricopeptide repeat protein [Daejeonella sp.]HQT23310.1 tetratricopeptide repeat protein [Daejeonella sp.]HQT58262.1 tetratricopeptide repeat protein [Daejeonella sp.]